MLKINRKGRATTLSKALLTAGLLGAAALSTLGAGSAKAATGCAVEIPWSDWVGGQTLTCKDKEFKWLSTQILGDLGDPITRVNATEVNPGDYLFNLDTPSTSNVFDFTYEATIISSNLVFTVVDINSNANSFANPPSVLKGTYTFTGPGANSPIFLTSTNGTPDFSTVNGGPTTITVNNNFDGNGSIDAMQNSFQQSNTVPGPLPLLGAGAAFGFSRRIRSRIKAARLV